MRVLFLCTGNSARSPIAEALLNRGAGRYVAESAGARPAARVNPAAIGALRDFGIEWKGHEPRGFEEVCSAEWDIAREECATFPGRPIMAHGSIPDPSNAPEARRHAAFRETVRYLARRIDLMLALPYDKLAEWAAESVP